MFKQKLLLLTAVLCLSTNLFSQKVVGYIDANLNQAGSRLNSMNFAHMTDFIYGFIQPDGSGNLPNPSTLSHFLTAKQKCANANVNMHFSSGGATLSSVFNTIGASPTNCANYATNIADIIQTHGLKGFDLDWEFPRTAQEQINQVNILKAIHDEFTARGKRSEWEIAIAVGGETPNVGNQGVYHTDYCSVNAFQYIDYLNVMSYDIGYNISGGDANHSSYSDANANITDWINKGCPASKIILGVPFYGRHRTNRGAAVYTHVYSDLSISNPAAAFNSDNVGDYYYNGKTTLENKVNLIQSRGGSGIMIWEVTYDRTDQYSLLKVIADAMAPYQCSAPVPDLGADQSICGLSSITLDGGVAQAGGRTFTWKKGNTTLVNQSPTANTYNVNSSGTYTVEVWEGGCNTSNDIEITANLGSIDLGGPYDLCSPVSVTLNSGMNTNGKTIEWQKNNVTISGATGATYEAKTAGTFKVVVSATGCSSINASATVTSSVPSASDVVICSAGQTANLTASESVDWYLSENAQSATHTGTSFSPTVNTNTTYWIAGSGSSTTPYTTLKSAFSGNSWQANPNVYGTKLVTSTEISIDAVTVDAQGGSVKINLVGSDGTTVVKTKTFNSVTGETELTLSWTGIAAGTYYLNAVGSASQLKVDNSKPASAFNIPGVLTSEVNCYEDWSNPYGDAYQTSQNYGNFINLKIQAGSACDRVPVQVTIDGNDPNCLTTNVGALEENIARVFPNPSNDEFYIETAINANITVLDAKGAVVTSFRTLDTVSKFGKDLDNGIYFVRVNAGTNQSVVRIIKTK